MASRGLCRSARPRRPAAAHRGSLAGCSTSAGASRLNSSADPAAATSPPSAISRGGELAGGDVGVGQARAQRSAVERQHERGEVVVALLGEQSRLDQRARRDHAAHDPRDELLALGRLVADLLGDGDLVAGVDQLGDVAVDRVVGHAGQRHTLVLADRPRGQDDVADARHDLGVVVEGLVEIAQAEEQDDVGVLLLERQVLAAHGCGHGAVLYRRVRPERMQPLTTKTRRRQDSRRAASHTRSLRAFVSLCLSGERPYSSPRPPGRSGRRRGRTPARWDCRDPAP